LLGNVLKGRSLHLLVALNFVRNNWVVNGWNFFFVGAFDDLHWFLNNWLLNLDVTPDFVAKAVVVAGYHSEVRSVPTCLLWGNKFNLPDVFLVWSNCSFKTDGNSLKVVTVGADEECVFRPVGRSIIPDCPLLFE